MNRKYFLIAGSIGLITLGVVTGVYFLIMNHGSVHTPEVNQSQSSKQEDQDINLLPASEQLAALESVKTVNPQITFPRLVSEATIAQADLPKTLSDLIDTNAGDLKIYRANFTDNVSGFEIQYTVKSNSSSAFGDVLYRSKISGWVKNTVLNSRKASLINISNNAFSIRGEYTQITESETSVNFLILSK